MAIMKICQNQILIPLINCTIYIVFLSGTAGDSLTYHRGMAFSTKDLDNDNWKNHCAESFKGAWWHNNCLYSNLNGMYYHGTHSHKEYTGVTWYHWKGDKYSLKNSAMKIRPESYGM